MSNVFEFKLQTADLKTVDAKDLSESLADLKLQIEKKFAEVKTKVSNTDLEQEAENFFKSLPLYVDGPNLRVQVGETYIKAKDNTEYKSIVDTINESIAKANAEMVAITQKFKKDKQNVQDETTEAMKQVTYPEFDDLTLLQAAYAGHPEYATKPARTREEKRLSRLTDRYEDANSDKARRRISKKIEKTADKIADRRADTARNMADAAADYTFAEELQNQAWYYNDILNALTKDPRSSRVHYLGESILIDTYHPLFRNTVNLKGTIRLTGMMVEQYKIKEQLEKGDRKLTVEEQRWIAEHPEDREVINKGGIIGGLVDGLVEHSNFPPESAKGLKSAAKIGALIGLGILGWHTIKKVFNIAGKNKKGEGIAWGLGAAGILIGIPALTGQRLDQLLFSGDPKQAIENLKNLGEKLGIDTKNMFASTNETVIWPAMGNLMYGDMTLEDAAKYIEYKDSKYTLKTNDYVIYLKQQRDAVTDEPAKQRYTDKLSLIQKAIDEKKINDITNSWCKTVNLDGAADKKILGETAYRAYLDGLTLGASLLETDKKLKISDKAKFDAYIREQIIDKKRNPSTITKDELKTAGLLIEVKTSSTNNADNNNSNNNTDNADNSDNSNNSNEKNNWEEFKEWTKPKREAFKKQCAKAKDNASVFMASLFSGEIFRGAESDVLKARRAELANLKKTLADLKKQSNIADKSVGNAAEIGLVETELKDADEMLAKIAVLSEEKVDKDLASVNIPDSEKENLTNAKKKINFDLKFQSE